MPIFDYECVNCNSQVERMVKASEDEVACVDCGIDMRKKVSSPGAIKFIGSGFYENDYKGKRYNDHKDPTGIVQA